MIRTGLFVNDADQELQRVEEEEELSKQSKGA
jgi:hypothetical protein